MTPPVPFPDSLPPRRHARRPRMRRRAWGGAAARGALGLALLAALGGGAWMLAATGAGRAWAQDGAARAAADPGVRQAPVPPIIEGPYTGKDERTFTLTVKGSGEIGAAPGLDVQWKSSSGGTGAVHIGEGYAPGTKLELTDGLTLTLGGGALADGQEATFKVTPERSSAKWWLKGKARIEPAQVLAVSNWSVKAEKAAAPEPVAPAAAEPMPPPPVAAAPLPALPQVAVTAPPRTGAPKASAPAPAPVVAEAPPRERGQKLAWGADFDTWTRVTGYLYTRSHGQRLAAIRVAPPASADLRVVNAERLRRLKNGRSIEYPAGTEIAMQTWEIGADMHRGAPGPLFFMRKEPPGYDPEGGNWRYAMTRPDLSVLAEGNSGRVTGCRNCHSKLRDRDFVPGLDR